METKNKETHVDHNPNIELGDNTVLHKFSSSDQEKIEMNRNEVAQSDLVDTLFWEDLHEEVVARTLTPLSYPKVQDVFGKSIVVLDSNLSNFNKNVIHDDMQVLELVHIEA